MCYLLKTGFRMLLKLCIMWSLSFDKDDRLFKH